MLRWALIFALVSFVAGLFGLAGLSQMATDLAGILFFSFVILLVFRGRRTAG